MKFQRFSLQRDNLKEHYPESMNQHEPADTNFTSLTSPKASCCRNAPGTMGYLTPERQCHALGAPHKPCPPLMLLWGVQSVLQYHPKPDRVLLPSHSLDITGEIRARKLNPAYFCDMILPHNTKAHLRTSTSRAFNAILWSIFWAMWRFLLFFFFHWSIPLSTLAGFHRSVNLLGTDAL